MKRLGVSVFKRKWMPAVAAVALLFGGIVAFPTVANASGVDEFSEAREFLSEHGVAPDARDRLIDELENGGRWDSFSSESAPVSITESQSDGFDVRVARYADGSVSVSRIEIPVPDSGVSTYSSPHSCTASGSWRNNCTVDMWVGAVSMSFKASYNVSTNQVSSVYGAGWTVGGACSTSLVYLGAPAWNIGRMDLNAQMCGAPYNTTFFLQVTVSGGVATESWG